MITRRPKSYEDFIADILDQLTPHHISSAVCILSELTQLDNENPDILEIFLRLDASRNASVICGPVPTDLWCRLHHSDTTFRTDATIDIIAGKLLNAGYFAFIGSLDKSATFPFYQILSGGDAKTVFKMLHKQASKLIAWNYSEQSINPGDSQVTS